jgi:hypothetical protein
MGALLGGPTNYLCASVFVRDDTQKSEDVAEGGTCQQEAVI